MTLSTMRTRILTDILNDPSGGTWANAELDSWINLGYLADLVPAIENMREAYFETVGYLDFAEDTQEIDVSTLHDVDGDALSDSLKRPIRVECKYGADDDLMLAFPIDKEEVRTQLANDVIGVSVIRNPGYYLTGGLSSTTYIGFLPIPGEAVTNGVKVWFIPNLSELSADGDEPSLPAAYHRLLLIYAGAKCLQKGNPKSARAKDLLDEYEVRKNQMIQGIRPRVQQGTKRVIETVPSSDLIG